MTAESNIFAAFGAVLGYIGAEAATVVSFERLLWPQRFYSNHTLSSTLKNAFLMPMGGPLHKAALKTLDVFFTHGLFKGPQQGHMLGTAFFRELSWSYTMHAGDLSHTEPLRNCLWARVLSYTTIPVLRDAAPAPDSKTCPDSPPPARPRNVPVRARTIVSHLTLSTPSDADIKNPKLPFVHEGTGTPTLGVLLAICASEASAILVAIAIFAACKSSWAALWLVPLFLRLISALFAVEREPLLSSSSSSSMDDPPCDFELNCPQSEGNFMIITGPPALVLQFFRHYGHPVRNRFREVLQVTIIAAFAFTFPFGLLCSVVWMSTPVQYAWLCYQLYVIFAMHIVRYSEVSRATTTEAKIAEIFCRDNERSGASGPAETAILFGQKRDKDRAIKASVVNTFQPGYKEGKQCTQELLRRRDLALEKGSGPQEMLRGMSRALSAL